jgi:hypothetical protein
VFMGRSEKSNEQYIRHMSRSLEAGRWPPRCGDLGRFCIMPYREHHPGRWVRAMSGNKAFKSRHGGVDYEHDDTLTFDDPVICENQQGSRALQPWLLWPGPWSMRTDLVNSDECIFCQSSRAS